MVNEIDTEDVAEKNGEAADEAEKNGKATDDETSAGVRDNDKEKETVENDDDKVPIGEVEMFEDHEHVEQPRGKKQQGPTKMKHIAKDPNARVKVEFNDMGESVGPGSVLLSSYLGPLVREHVPATIKDWRQITEEMKTVL